MALGGGTFITQNKVLPGAYINFISARRATGSLGSRGIVTMPLELDWGPEGVVEIENYEFADKVADLTGYDYSNEKNKGLRDLFLNAKTLLAYRVNANGGVKAANTYAEAKYVGTRGNDLKVSIQANVDEPEKFDVTTILGTKVVDEQTVSKVEELKPNNYVAWKTEPLSAVAATPLTGGMNGTVDGEAHQGYLDAIEPYTFNCMGLTSTDDEIKQLYINFVKRMRDEVGAKFQLVLHRKAGDHEAVINVCNDTEDADWPVSSAVYWVTGAEGGCEVNKSCLNKKYDGEFTVKTGQTQAQLTNSIKNGEFVLHNVGVEIRVLDDINSFISFTEDKNQDFASNQTIRVIDQIANDIANIFNSKYLGNIWNDADGRVSFGSDVIKHHEELQRIRAIENFDPADVEVLPGEAKGAVAVKDKVTIVNTMRQLYMVVTVA